MSITFSVLLVEDNPIAQLGATMILKKRGIEPMTVSSGLDALNITQVQQFDFILMDIGLEEGTDGIEVTRKIQLNSLNRNTPVIILSANSSDTYQDRLNEIKIVKYLLKPLTSSTLDDIIELIKNDF